MSITLASPGRAQGVSQPREAVWYTGHKKRSPATASSSLPIRLPRSSSVISNIRRVGRACCMRPSTGSDRPTPGSHRAPEHHSPRREMDGDGLGAPDIASLLTGASFGPSLAVAMPSAGASSERLRERADTSSCWLPLRDRGRVAGLRARPDTRSRLGRARGVGLARRVDVRRDEPLAMLSVVDSDPSSVSSVSVPVSPLAPARELASIAASMTVVVIVACSSGTPPARARHCRAAATNPCGYINPGSQYAGSFTAPHKCGMREV